MPETATLPRFVTGSPMRHVIVMAGTGAIGLIAVFSVDLLNLFYISLLGQEQIAAAVGFAGTVTFFQTSLAIGMTIGVAAVVSREIGAGQRDDARRVASASLALMVAVLAVVGIATALAVTPLLAVVGARGATRAFAAGFLAITSLSLPLLAVGMCCSALLRSVGDARRSMNITLAGAVVTAIADPVLIFGLHLDLQGAAISTVLSRVALAWLGWRGAARTHDLLGPIQPGRILRDARAVFRVAGPAILTNLATPVGGAYVTSRMAEFGSEAIAGQATTDRITPVAFGLVFALSGAIGPIIGQNLGAGRIDRIAEALRDALMFVLATVCIAWVILFALQGGIVVAFSAHGVAASLIRLYCDVIAGSFLFTGALFVANAAFNNLGFPLLSTAFNWGRATLGTIPFVTYGAAYGPRGVLLGVAGGSVIFGIAAVVTAFAAVNRLGARGESSPHLQVAVPAASTGSAALAAFASRLRHDGRN
ncbi:MAG: polysaccharide biosynthesis C-terminal domain-containing protein [Acetobacteraceae bacterium]|nr:polysaccharide biosynthesis C-terminal domain-containing protein [Acetobacteraceae bacterium]